MTVFLLFCLGLLLLVLGAKLFVESSELIARYYGISEMIIGMVIVGFGTSLPELFISSIAVLDASPKIALANVIGSNIANIALIGGLILAFLGVTPNIQDFSKADRFFFIMSGMLMMGFIIYARFFSHQVSLTFMTSVALLLMLAYYLYGEAKNSMGKGSHLSAKIPGYRDYIRGFLGFCMLLGGSQIAIHNLHPLALSRGVSEYIIGIFVVAVATSLPELITSVMAIASGSKDIAFGNIIGSNIFNMFGVLGVSSLFGSIIISESYFFDALMMLITTLVFVFLSRMGGPKRLARLTGMVLLALYVLYIWWTLRL